jgi:hypothetical protein
MEPKRALRHALARRQFVKISRRGDAGVGVYGFPLAVGPRLVLLHEVKDFDVDGFTVLLLADITGVRSGDSERFVERALRDSGELAGARPGRRALQIGEWKDVFAALGATGEIVMIEGDPSAAEEFFVGKVVGLTQDAVGFHHVDAMAVWDPEPIVIPFTSVRQVWFGTRYTRVFARYPSGVRRRR